MKSGMTKESILTNVFKSGIAQDRLDLIKYAIAKGFIIDNINRRDLLKACMIDHLNYNFLDLIDREFYESLNLISTLTLNNLHIKNFKGFSPFRNIEEIIINNCTIDSFEGVEEFEFRRKDCVSTRSIKIYNGGLEQSISRKITKLIHDYLSIKGYKIDINVEFYKEARRMKEYLTFGECNVLNMHNVLDLFINNIDENLDQIDNIRGLLRPN